jgi:uncharacterized caspase-like protein
MARASHASSAPEQGRFAETRANEKIRGAIENGKAARTVASHANDAQDCASLLEMLGLDALQGKHDRRR